MSRMVYCGDVAIGGGAPISIQSMTNTKTSDIKSSLLQIERLQDAGCQIIRMAVPNITIRKFLIVFISCFLLNFCTLAPPCVFHNCIIVYLKYNGLCKCVNIVYFYEKNGSEFRPIHIIYYRVISLDFLLINSLILSLLRDNASPFKLCFKTKQLIPYCNAFSTLSGS